MGLIQKIQKYFNPPKGEDDSLIDRLEEVIEENGEEMERLSDNEKMLLVNALNLRNVLAEDVMIPRADICAIPFNTSYDDIIDIILERGHSRYPIFRKTLDDAVGLIHIKDILPYAKDPKKFVMRKAVRKILFVAPSMRALDLLLQMQLARVHMALVVDEHGGVDGLISIENLVEQIVGEIQDEHDVESLPELQEKSDGSFVVDARYPIEEFEARFGRLLTDKEQEEDIDTLGGLISTLVGRVPLQGELVTHSSGIEFEVMDVDPRRVKQIRIRNAEMKQS